MNLSETVTGVNTLTVKGNLSETVTGNKTSLVKGNLVETVTGKSELHVYSTDPSKIETTGDITLKTSQGSKDIKLSTQGTGKTHITNTTNITAVNDVPSDSSGALVVDGGVYIKKDTWIGQNFKCNRKYKCREIIQELIQIIL